MNYFMEWSITAIIMSIAIVCVVCTCAIVGMLAEVVVDQLRESTWGRK
jgi:hypothetical protein